MSQRRHTIEEIRNTPELREQVCSPDPEPKSDNGGLMDLIFDTIDASFDATLGIIDAGADAALGTIDAAMGGTSKKNKK